MQATIISTVTTSDFSANSLILCHFSLIFIYCYCYCYFFLLSGQKNRGSMDRVHIGCPWTRSKRGVYGPGVHVLSSPERMLYSVTTDNQYLSWTLHFTWFYQTQISCKHCNCQLPITVAIGRRTSDWALYVINFICDKLASICPPSSVWNFTLMKADGGN